MKTAVQLPIIDFRALPFDLQVAEVYERTVRRVALGLPAVDVRIKTSPGVSWAVTCLPFEYWGLAG